MTAASTGCISVPPFHHTVSSRSKVVARFLCESSPSTARIPVLTTDVLPVPITAVPLDLPVAPASDAFSAYEAFLSSLFLSHPPLPFLLPHHPPAMGACMSSGGIEVSEEDKRLHREAEKSLKEVRPYHLPTKYLHRRILSLSIRPS